MIIYNFCFKWQITLSHVVKIITHLRADHLDWVEDKSVADTIKEEKQVVKDALKPGKYPGGSKEENLGVAYDFPDAKVRFICSIFVQILRSKVLFKANQVGGDFVSPPEQSQLK